MTAGAPDVWLDVEREPLRVLVADEDPIVRRLMASVLSELGHDVRASSTGGEAWRAFAEWQPELVVLDASLGDIDGLDVCRRIRDWDEKREVFVLFLIGRDNVETLERALDAGGDEFILKPLTPEALRARLIIARRRIAQDAARRTAEEELSRTRWLAGISDAALALQHEINNPLSALLGHAELMQMELEDRGQRNEMLDVIHEQALRIVDVVRRLRRLRNPESVDHVSRSRMINLWKGHVS
jgi:DNA-binding response OmpR family regulator